MPFFEDFSPAFILTQIRHWNWIAFAGKSIVISPAFLYHLIRRDIGRLANKTFTSNPIVSSKQELSGLKITNWICIIFRGFREFPDSTWPLNALPFKSYDIVLREIKKDKNGWMLNVETKVILFESVEIVPTAFLIHILLFKRRL